VEPTPWQDSHIKQGTQVLCLMLSENE